VAGHGNIAAVRAAAGEPDATPVVLEAPEYLSDGEKHWWKYYAELLGDYSITTVLDAKALERLACMENDIQQLRKYFRRLEVENPDKPEEVSAYYCINVKGEAMRRNRPERATLTELERNMVLLLGKFGLTPSERSKVVDLGKGQGSVDPDREFTSN
jgi:phage terminase small subunit